MDSDKKIMVELRDLCVRAGERVLIESANVALRAGTLCALVGRNGSGKSTLLRTICGLRPATGGEVMIGGRELRRLSPRELARTVAFVNTERVRVPSLTCRDIVAMGRAPYTNWVGRMQASDREIVDHALETVGMAGFGGRALTTMSDGECQRVMIARAIAQATPVILLDEPTSFLDMPGRYSLARLLGELTATEGKTVLFSTHELDIASDMTGETWIIDTPRLLDVESGRLVTDGYISRIFGITPRVQSPGQY